MPLEDSQFVGECTWPEVAQVLDKLARPERLELPTTWFEARYSIQLSYGRIGHSVYLEVYRLGFCREMGCTVYRKLSYEGNWHRNSADSDPLTLNGWVTCQRRDRALKTTSCPQSIRYDHQISVYGHQLMSVSVQWPILRSDPFGQ